jgi:hypothetical protein
MKVPPGKRLQLEVLGQTLVDLAARSHTSTERLGAIAREMHDVLKHLDGHAPTFRVRCTIKRAAKR